jgi:hypothetical protein
MTALYFLGISGEDIVAVVLEGLSCEVECMECSLWI